jgi:Flp pilus assembly protein TadD
MASLARALLIVCAALSLSACASSQKTGAGQPSLNLARTALDSGVPNIALNAANEVLDRSPRDAEALEIKADALSALGRGDEAAKSYQAALLVNPNSVAAHIGLGRAALAFDVGLSERHFVEALQREPRNTVALIDLGIALDLQGRHDDAQRRYAEAMAITPALRAAEVNLALSLALSGRAAEGLQIIRPRIGDPSMTPQMRETMAAIAAMAQDRETAETLLRTQLTPEQIGDAISQYDRLRKLPR